MILIRNHNLVTNHQQKKRISATHTLQSQVFLKIPRVLRTTFVTYGSDTILPGQTSRRRPPLGTRPARGVAHSKVAACAHARPPTPSLLPSLPSSRRWNFPAELSVNKIIFLAGLIFSVFVKKKSLVLNKNNIQTQNNNKLFFHSGRLSMVIEQGFFFTLFKI